MIHGGAGRIERGRTPPEVEAGTRAGLAAALDAGTAVLAGGGGALDAVEAAVRVLEDDPHFNAGRGAALTREGTAELDASIMDGRTRAAGAVARVSYTRSPVALARAVMERSRHVFLAGVGADAFSRDHGLEQVENTWFVTDARRANLAELLARSPDAYDVDMKYGTVGAVARDAAGHLAAATSTGGRGDHHRSVRCARARRRWHGRGCCPGGRFRGFRQAGRGKCRAQTALRQADRPG